MLANGFVGHHFEIRNHLVNCHLNTKIHSGQILVTHTDKQCAVVHFNSGGLEFSLIYDEHSFRLTEDTLFCLSGLGIDTDLVIGEGLEWLLTSRKNFGGWSWDNVLWRRVEVGMQADATAVAAEKDRRGKAGAERVIAEAPPLDWAMEAAGLGEVAPTGPSVVHAVLAEKMAKMKTDHELLWHFQSAKTLPEPSDLDDLLYKFEDLTTERQKLSTLHERESHPDYYDTCDKIDDARQVIHVEAMRQAPPAPVVAPASLPNEAIGKAVHAIHTHLRRFMTPASMREHDFLRSIIKQKVEK